jgi:hypothetical protein
MYATDITLLPSLDGTNLFQLVVMHGHLLRTDAEV